MAKTDGDFCACVSPWMERVLSVSIGWSSASVLIPASPPASTADSELVGPPCACLTPAAAAPSLPHALCRCVQSV
eukprot:6163132-Pleurochrysis_carterae.AAC.1